MKPFQPNVPQDIQAFLVANFSKYGHRETAKNVGYFELHYILYRYINWTFSNESDRTSYRSHNDNKTLEDAYTFFENGELDMGYDVLRNSDMYKQTYWKRADVPFNPQSIQSMKQSLESL